MRITHAFGKFYKFNSKTNDIMKIILVDAINTFVIKGEGIFNEMYKMLEQYPNRKIWIK